jgi:HlyD family secretion protein
MSITTTNAKQLTRGQNAQMPALLEFYSPSAALLETRAQGAARGVIWTVGSMFVACTLAAALVPIDKVVTSAGKVTAVQNTIVVQPLETAIVREIDVQEGQVVKKGQLLAKLDPTFTTSDTTASVQTVNSLRAEVERRQDERAGIDYHPASSDPAVQVQAAIFAQRKAEREFKIENYKQKIASLTATLAKAGSDIQAYSERLQVAQTVEGKRRELAQLGWGSQLNQLAAQDTRLDLQRNLTEAQQTARSAANDLQAMKAEAAGDDQNWQSQNASDLTDAQRKLDQAQGDLTKNSMRSKLVEIRADQDATVLTVAPVSVGSVLQSGDQFLKLVPLDAPLEVDGTILGSEAGYVRVGDHVTLKFDTFPFTHYGSADGTVTVVSPDSFMGQQSTETVTHGVDTSTAVIPDPGQAYYRVKISIDKVNLHDTPRGFHVAPGMPITADIMVGKRTVLTYIFSRALPVAMDGMREP